MTSAVNREHLCFLPVLRKDPFVYTKDNYKVYLSPFSLGAWLKKKKRPNYLGVQNSNMF